MDYANTVVVDVQGRAWVRKRLVSGLAISTLVAQTVDLNGLTYLLRIPSAAKIDLISDFSAGGLLQPRAEDIAPESAEHRKMLDIQREYEEWLVNALRIATSEFGMFAVIEDQGLDATRERARRSWENVFLWKAQCFHFIGPGADPALIRSTLSRSKLWIRLGFLGRHDAASEINNDLQFAALIESSPADWFSGLFCDVFDGETNLLAVDSTKPGVTRFIKALTSTGAPKAKT